jgi:hypothetical protein
MSANALLKSGRRPCGTVFPRITEKGGRSDDNGDDDRIDPFPNQE